MSAGSMGRRSLRPTPQPLTLGSGFGCFPSTAGASALGRTRSLSSSRALWSCSSRLTSRLRSPTVLRSRFWETALVGAVILLLLSPGRAQTVQRVNWSILLLFVGLFVVVTGAVNGGVIASLDGVFPVPGPGHPTGALLAVVGTSIGGSQVVSNVPWVALQIPVLTGLGYGASSPIIWMALAASSTLAGNITFLGAASNLILVDSAEKLGIRIPLSEFVRHGVPLAAVTIAVLVICLALGL